MTQSISEVADEPTEPVDPVAPVVTRRRPFPLTSGLILIAALGIATLYATVTQSDYNIYLFNTFLLTCIGALAMNLLMGTTGLVSVGSAGFLAAGAYSAVFLDREHLPFVVAVIGGGVVAAVLGVIVALPAIRLRGLALGLGTISVHYVVVFAVDQYQQRTPGAGAVGFHLPSLFGTTVGVQDKWAWLLVGVVAMAIILVVLLSSGRTGRALRLMRDQETIAATQAVPVTGYKMMIFGISSFMFGVEGALAAYVAGQVSSDQFTLTLALQFLAMVMVGGLDSVWGAAFGAAIFVALPYATADTVSSLLGAHQASVNGAKYGVIVYAVIVVAFIVTAPSGLVGLFQRLWRLASRWIPARRSPRPAGGASGAGE